ncbi:hypothetical protein ACFFU1_02100 [Algibacter miyuki]|uniref:DUF4476 domain-containing protein n=1 Tax=Algibacter miyuki TaxID=1306933 RepID=A0ABV5GWX2_9FLAO|nr:hypothetical protein [Algibacter miyuki]MDN3665006.1 hypothetical protein [Algibacter miyuki]
MKKKLESELVSIAHRILKLKGKEDVIKMHSEAKELFEKLSVLKFAQENFEEKLPSVGDDSSFFSMLGAAFNHKISDNIEIEDKTYINLDDNEHAPITEPLMETIKDMVAQMPHETQAVDELFEQTEPKTAPVKQNLEDITSGFEDMPIFDPVSNSENKTSSEKKSLNDKLKSGGLKIGLNDKIAFINHLFDGKNEDYDRVISQLNTFLSYNNAKAFIETMVKPDYNNWKNKEEFETRFMEIIEAKFE